jgi:AbrB family looped-hinge helix DNA binding protein
MEPVIGSTKVGERGQIVIPGEIRKKCGIEPGDTMIVMAKPGPGGWNMMIMKASAMAEFLDHMQGTSEKIRNMLRNGEEGSE